MQARTQQRKKHNKTDAYAFKSSNVGVFFSTKTRVMFCMLACCVVCEKWAGKTGMIFSSFFDKFQRTNTARVSACAVHVAVIIEKNMLTGRLWPW